MASTAAAAPAQAAAPATQRPMQQQQQQQQRRGGRAPNAGRDRNDRDREREREEDAQPGVLEERVKSFVLRLQSIVHEQENRQQMQMLYEDEFNRLADRFGGRPWPTFEELAMPAGTIEPIVELLYRELYFRHMYWKVQSVSNKPPTLQLRTDSWNNYCKLFDMLLTQTSAKVRLSMQWLYDLLDEFVYQQQTNIQYRNNLLNKTPEEITYLRQNPDTWSIKIVHEYLQKFVDKANDLKAAEPQVENMLYSTLCSFSYVQMCRLFCIIGDYWNALKVFDAVDMSQKGAHLQVLSCHVTYKYYTGFAYMMLRRFVDAIKMFSSVLVHMTRGKSYHARSYQADSMGKKSDHIYALLAISVSLCPQRVDEIIHTTLREKHGEHLAKMAKGEEAAFLELFNYGSPKFINVAPPNYEEHRNFGADPLQHQQRVFAGEVRQHLLVPNLRSFLRLYTTIPVTKLADFLETDEATLRAQLLSFKHMTRAQVWSSGPLLSGKWAQTLDVDFYLEGDMVHMREAKPTHNFSDFFLRHTKKLNAVA
eukprot:TRINITY_DN448_c0_g1_i1.p1 TRINITY_DN448_c0_g1~~TRINITY_DN448_c0_g1_i1.p1  ORF type:complete len:535 (-),score=204.83 TRINITY_DN448_c0_g1_i1:85-1689(-)